MPNLTFNRCPKLRTQPPRCRSRRCHRWPTHPDSQVEAFRNRPLDAAHYTFVWVDALVVKVREHGRIVNVHALVAVGVNADGQREVLGLDVASDEDGAGWLAILRSFDRRGLSGVRLVVSDAHRRGAGLGTTFHDEPDPHR